MAPYSTYARPYQPSNSPSTAASRTSPKPSTIIPVNLRGDEPDEEEGVGEQQRRRPPPWPGDPVPLHQRGEDQPGADAGEREVDEPGREALDLPVDHRQQDAAEDEREHGGELGAEAEPPEGERRTARR